MTEHVRAELYHIRMHEKHHTTVAALVQFAHVLIFSMFSMISSSMTISKTSHKHFTFDIQLNMIMSFSVKIIPLLIYTFILDKLMCVSSLFGECENVLFLFLYSYHHFDINMYLVTWLIIISDDLASLSSVVFFVFTRKVCPWIHKHKRHFDIKPLY